MANKALSVTYKTASDFLKDAKDCDVIDDLFRQLKDHQSQTILDDAQLRLQEDWSKVATQVVGSESVGGYGSAE